MRPRGNLSVALAAIGATVVLTAAIHAGRQQEPPPAAGLVVKGKAPVSNEILKVTLPKPQEADLPNGLHLMVLEDHGLPRISFQIVIPGAGGYYDDPGLTGISSYTAQMMREGTKTRTTLQMSRELETMAAGLNVSSSIAGQTASVSGGALTENFDRLFELAADVLLNPAFPEDEWNRLRTRARASLIQQRTQPGFLASEMFSKVVYGSHPAGRNSATPVTLDAIRRDAMIELHRTRFVPDHAVIAFAGDITLEEARKKVEAKLGAWKKAGTAKPGVEEPPALGPAKVYLVARPNSVQTNIVVGTQSMTRSNPDYIPLTVANRVLGGTMGRLFRHLREEKGYTYGVGSGFSATHHTGSWQASTAVRTAVTDPALTDLLKDVEDMCEMPVPDNELMDAKRAIVAGFALSLETPEQVLGYYMQSWVYGLPKDYWETYPARISEVTPAQAQAVAKKYWNPERLHIVAVGDAEKIKDVLAKKGTLEVFDTDGNPVK
ncbi:MAG TPA: pitrilysin family protein [Vicinamibacterales bacterium]|nr:pitrilysin family protein [Vicinamibacterales bacterium]